ncbi:MAG: alpha/beta hydrolase [Chitinophagales bacterium]
MAQNVPMGKVLEGLKINSKILDKSVNYSVYLPPDYDHSNRAYPIVYLLHGYTDNETAWVQFGQMNTLLDEAIAAQKVPPMVVVMPDAGVSWYINNHDGTVRYEDFFIQELMPKVETDYRIRQKKEFRGITGLSMGGYGSLIYAMKHPDLFAACAPLSAAIYTKEEVTGYDMGRWNHVEGVLYGKDLEGKARLTEHWAANNPMEMATEMGTDSLKQVHYYFDCGDEDFLFRGNAAIHVLFREMNVPHEFRIRDGEHNWTYWRTGIIGALEFIGERFHR